ncbi:MAG: YbgC/FadM family acyl-CoA thioesterase [Parvibaculum sp.]|nr:YbgC/FadM family acyl-CoA thioesterase [Parvibaculum sp.]
MSAPIDKWPDLSGRITGTTHILPVRVYYEDTDFSGIVYHANYLRFAERGRSDFLRLTGISHTDLFDGPQKLAFAIHRMEIDFVRPARIDDLLEVRTRYVKASGARLEAEQSIWLMSGPGEPAEIWRAKVMAACIDGEGRPRRLPLAAREALVPYVTEATL